jgi:YVTN family beta-propeller protein
MRRTSVALALLLVLLLAQPAAALSVLQTIPVGLHPFGIAQTPDGHLYVANNGSNTISVVDPATATSTTISPTITVGRGPGEIAVDPVTDRAFVANFLDATVSVVDIAAGVVIATLTPGGLGVAVDPALGRLYATSGTKLVVFDTASLLPVATLLPPAGSGYWGVAVDTSRHLGYVGDLGGTGVTVVDLLTNSVVTTVNVGGKVRFALTSDPASGRVFAATDGFDSFFSVIDASTNTVVSTVGLGRFASHIAVASADRVYVTEQTSTSGGDVAAVDPTTSGLRRYPINLSAPFGGPKPSGLVLVGPKVYVTLNGLSDLAVMAESAPVVSVTVAPSAPTTNETLTASVTASDADLDPLTFAYQWTKNGSDLAGATALTLDLSVPGNGDHGDTIAFRVSVSDGMHTTTVTSQPVVVANTAPVADTVSIAPTTAFTDSVLTATATGHDADGDALTFAYQWTKNGADIAGATSSTLDLAVSGNGDHGDTIAVRATASDGSLSSAPVTSAGVVIVNAAPVASVSLTTTTPTTRVMLVATVTASDADADPLTFTYVWTVDGTVRQTTVTTATTDSFDLSKPGNGNHGDVITVDVTASDGTLTATASASATVVGGKPTP